MEQLLSKRQTQQMLVEMLDQLVDYLEKNNLRYYLVGGTLLGAIRHKGFIPWDDDIDIGMPRRDYERLIELAKVEPIGECLELISDMEGTFSNPFSELIRIDTRLERATQEYIREECIVKHLFIDIIPQDGWPSDDRKARLLFYRMKMLRYLVQCSRSRLGHGTSVKRMLIKSPAVIVMRMAGYPNLIRRMNQIAKKYDYDNSDYVGAVTYGIYGPGERCLRAQTVQFEKVEFEGKEYNAPGCWRDYLTQLYGDYMKLPSVEKRIDHRMQVWIVDHKREEV